jgi:hypothetical protein
MMQTLTLTILLLLAQQQQPAKPPTPEQIRQMQEMLGPGPEHRTFHPLEGTWTVDASYNMGGGQTLAVRGRATNRLILGGRFLVSESTSSEQKSGMTIDAMTIYGFDRRTGEYTLVGYDTLGTYYVTAVGTKASGANEVVMQGQVQENGRTKKYDMVLRWVDQDTYATAIIFHMPDGPLKVVDVTHRRVK